MARTQSYIKKLDHFLAANPEAVEKYEATGDNPALEYCYDDIIEIWKKIKEQNKNLDFDQTMKHALDMSIQYDQNIIDSLEQVTSIAISQDMPIPTSNNIIQQYFREINTIYTNNDNNFDIEYCEENRDKLIQMNLKTVISIAKKYQGLGLTLDELISAGNLGLIIAWDKFDPSRSKLKTAVLEAVNQLPDQFSYHELINCLNNFLKYGDIQKKVLDSFSPDKIYTKQQLYKWINSNVRNAKFSSIATMWIKAYILIELDNNSRTVKKPKSEIYKDREKYGAYKKDTTVNIDAPVSGESGTVLADMMYMEDDTETDLETAEAYYIYKDGLEKLLDGVKTRDRSVFLKKFGIGLPRPMLPREIAEQEGLSIARISQIFQNVIEQMQYNAIKYNINPNILLEASRKIK